MDLKLKDNLKTHRIEYLEKIFNEQSKNLKKCEKEIEILQTELQVYRNNFIENYIKKDSAIKDLHESLDQLIKSTDSSESISHNDNQCIYWEELQKCKFQLSCYKSQFKELNDYINDYQNKKNIEINKSKQSLFSRINCFPFYT